MKKIVKLNWVGKMTIDPRKDIPLIPPDPDYCGLGSANTGPHDPWYRRACVPHDLAYEQLTQGEWPVFGTFAKNIAKGMLDGAWMLLTGPLYLLIGGFGGVIRYQQLKRRQNLKDENENLGDGL